MPKVKLECPLCKRYGAHTGEGMDVFESFPGPRVDRDEADSRVRLKGNGPLSTELNKKAPMGYRRKRDCPNCKRSWVSLELPEDFVEMLAKICQQAFGSTDAIEKEIEQFGYIDF